MQPFRRVAGFVLPYRRQALWALLLLTLMVCLDLALPYLIQRLIDEGIAARSGAVVVTTALSMLCISALSALVAIANNTHSVRVGESVARDLREALFTHVQRLSLGNLDRRKTGQLMVRLTNDVNTIKHLTQVSLRVGTRAPLMMLGSGLLMFRTSPELALTTLPLLVLTAALLTAFILRVEPLYRRLQEKVDALTDVLQENITGIRLIKAFVRADFERERFAAVNDEVSRRALDAMKVTFLMTPSLTLCVNVGTLIVLWAGGTQTIEGRLSVGQLVAFSNYMLTTMAPLLMMTTLSNIWAAGMASARRLNSVLEEAPDVQDVADARVLPTGAATRVAFEDVSFAYRGARGEPALSHVDLHAEPGQTLGILGATGAGKSTLVQLIFRSYDATSGRVSLGGVDVKGVTEDSILAQVAVVPQEAVLFSGSVRDNICYGKPGATDAEVRHAAAVAQAHEFIIRMPGGYGARVEQRGANLSGGQKQRLAIARALLLEPKLLILDDSTSAVDIETESRIYAALAASRHVRTTFVVAQRISTVLHADQILVVDKGRVVARGAHHDLLASSAVYQEIYNSQLGADLPSFAGWSETPP